jgi:cob(I)alamin adenosyltransferase
MSKQVIIYYGCGEGKTSAALGHALRAAAYGKVAVLFFMKGRKTGEIKILKKIKNISIHLAGPKQFLTKETRQQHQQAASKAMNLAMKLIKNHKLVILDEILYALEYKLITEADIINLIKKSRANLILTGSKVSKKILRYATIATEFKKVKHHYEQDKRTIKGIDY